MIRQSSAARRPNRLANRKASPFSKQSIAHAARVLAPTLFALTFAGVAHAQGTMDFSGAQTLMGTFKTFAVYAGAVICFGGLICGVSPQRPSLRLVRKTATSALRKT